MTAPTTAVQATPGSVVRAVRLMFAGAVLSVLTALVIILVAPSVGVVHLYGRPPIFQSYTQQVVQAALGGAVQFALWLWMAWKNKSGRSWARVLSTLLCGLCCIVVPLALIRGGSVEVKPFNAATWLVALAATIQLWLPESGPFYRR